MFKFFLTTHIAQKYVNSGKARTYMSKKCAKVVRNFSLDFFQKFIESASLLLRLSNCNAII